MRTGREPQTRSLHLFLKQIGFVLMLTGLSGCGGNGTTEPAKTPPAQVQGTPKEGDLAMVTLTPQAEQRLGIATAPVERRAIARARTYGGEIEVPPGRLIDVSAPMAGTLIAPPSSNVPEPGARVQKGQVIFLLVPLDRDLRAEAERDATSAAARLTAAQQRVKRADQLLRDGAGSARALEEARAELLQAEAADKAAKQRLQHLKGQSAATGGVAIEAPQDAVLQELHAAVGQTVSAGTPLFKIAQVNQVWVRVPVYVGDLNLLQRGQSAQVHGLAAEPGAPARSASPVVGPPSANADAATVHLFYEVANNDGALRPGQKVGVTLALRGEEEWLVVPWSAVIHDVNGGTWVYANTGPQIYQRRRVEVKFVSGSNAVLARGPAVGTKVVIAGAAELFGTEFGNGK